MAVTVADLRDALHVPAGQDTAVLERLLATGEALVEHHAPDAPSTIKDEAIIRWVAYSYDAPAGAASPNPFRNSGVQSLLREWVKRRAVLIEAGR